MKHFLVLLLVSSGFVVSAQTKISGQIKDSSGFPLAYVNVFFKNTSEGTISNEDGKFYLESKTSHSTVVFSFMGYTTREVEISQRNVFEMQVVLEESADSLDEVVVYTGKTSKKNNPAIDILRKIWEHRRENGVKKFSQYQFDKYEKIEFDINTIDSAFMQSRVFKGMEFIFDQVDTSRITGKSYLPIFINEAFSNVYGDNLMNLEKEILQGNKNSGFQDNQALIEFVKDLYKEYDVYDNYLKFFDKAFTSPLSRTGIDVYNYVLRDSAFRDNKWCYNIVYYPRRKNELTFRGDFWVNDTTWAIKEINLQASRNANLNWVRDVYIEQEFDVLNDSVFLITRDYFMSDFSFFKKETAQGMYGKRTTLYDNYVFDRPKSREFYRERVDPYQEEVYNRPDEFWAQNRMEKLSKDETGIYKMLDTLVTVPRFKQLYNLTTTLVSGYYQIGNIDVGPVYSVFGYNEAEKLRLRVGGRTYFGQNDPWRLEVFGAYGFGDEKFKYGISGKVLLDRKSRLILHAGNRKDIEQIGASLTSSNDVLGRSLASSALISVGSNDRLSKINLTTAGFEIEPFKNLIVRITGSYRTLESATETFNMDYKVKEDGAFTGEVKGSLKQPEMEVALFYTPGRKTSGYGVERLVVNDGNFPSFYLSYGYGLKNILGGDFEYKKIQAYYTQPWNIGGFGRLFTTVEIGKTFDEVPLGLLSPIPGNQTYFSMYNTFSQLDYYEFVSDTYASFHLLHNFGGRIFSRIPLLRDLDLREIVGFRAVYGTISEKNISLNASNITYLAPEDIYWEWSVGVGNIFRIFRIDFNFRGNYLDLPEARKFGVTGIFEFAF